MADVATTTSASPQDPGHVTGRRIRRVRGLPGGRAVVGAFLVAAAAIGVFAAYLDATSTPDTRYLVAERTIAPGTRFTDLDAVIAAVSSSPLDLGPELAARAIPVAELETLVGRVVIAPLERGDLLSRSTLADDGSIPDTQTMSFALPSSDAVGGALRAGERIDVLATYGSGDRAYTSYVVRGVQLVRVTTPDGGAITGAGGEVSLTVALSSPADVLALGHAINTASVFVTRSTVVPGDDEPAPGAYIPEPQEQGPLPDGAAPAIAPAASEVDDLTEAGGQDSNDEVDP